jgi:hypothetical protein
MRRIRDPSQEVSDLNGWRDWLPKTRIKYASIEVSDRTALVSMNSKSPHFLYIRSVEEIGALATTLQLLEYGPDPTIKSLLGDGLDHDRVVVIAQRLPALN